MIDVHQWRVTIGLWSCRLLPHLTKRVSHRVTTNTNCVNSLSLKLIVSDNLISLMMFLFLVLILSGDVEVNPATKIGKLNVVQSV